MKEKLIATMMSTKKCDEQKAIEILMIAVRQWDMEQAAIAAAKEGR
jgi:hypothetical protein